MQVELNSRGSQALLATLVPEVGLPCDSQDILDRLSSLSFNDASVLGLTESADTHLEQINSRLVTKTMVVSHVRLRSIPERLGHTREFGTSPPSYMTND